MANFVAICSKNGQRIELSLSRGTIDEAKAELHNQGFAIIEIREAEAASVESDAAKSLSTFYFDILVDGKRKSWQIKSSDSFRAYIKLVDDLHYQVVSLCDNPDASEEEKKFFTNRIREMYAVFKDRWPKEKNLPKEPSWPKVPDADPAAYDSTSVLARQVAKYHALIERISGKIEYLLANYSSQLGEDRTFRLKELVSSLKQLKNIANPDKLKLIGESALDRIGQLEIELIEKGFIIEKKEALSQTNLLLREIGSRKRVVLPEDDFVVQAKVLWNSFRDNYLSKTVKAVSKPVSGESGSSTDFLYFKNVRELKAYQTKRSEINYELVRWFFKLKGEKRERLLLKRKLIDQNIELLTSRIKNRSVSYVKLKRWVSKYSESFFFLCRSLGDFLAYSLFVYSVVYSVSLPVSKFLGYGDAKHSFVFMLAALSFSAFCAKQVRDWLSFSVFSAMAFLFVSAIGVNF